MSFWSSLSLFGNKDKREFRYLSGQLSNVLHEFVQSDDFVEGGCYCIKVHIDSNKEKEKFLKLNQDFVSFIEDAKKKLPDRSKEALGFSTFYIEAVAQTERASQWVTIQPGTELPSTWEVVVSYRSKTWVHDLPSQKMITLGRWSRDTSIDVPLFGDFRGMREPPRFVSRKAFRLYYINGKSWFVQTHSQGDCMHIQKGSRITKLLSRKYRGIQIVQGDTIHLYNTHSETNTSTHVVIRIRKKENEV